MSTQIPVPSDHMGQSALPKAHSFIWPGEIEPLTFTLSEMLNLASQQP